MNIVKKHLLLHTINWCSRMLTEQISQSEVEGQARTFLRMALKSLALAEVELKVKK